MNAETRSEMFGRLLKQIPNPTTELNYSTSFELLVAVTLSAQALIRALIKSQISYFLLQIHPKLYLSWVKIP